MTDSTHVVCLIFAAGKSSRFGSNKMHYHLNNGLSIVEQTIRNYKSVFEKVHLVVSNTDGFHDLAGRYQADLILSAKAERGMSHSVIAGVSKTDPLTGWLMALGDMPFVQTATIQKILEHADESSIVIPRHNGKEGNPVFIGRNFRASLTELSGDRGAKSMIKNNINRVIYVDVDDPGVLHDIDTLDDAKQLQNH